MNAPEPCPPRPCPPPLSVPIKSRNAPPRLPWGFWATTGLGVALIFADMEIQAGVLVLYVAGLMIFHGSGSLPTIEALTTNGTVFSLAVILGAPLTIFLGRWFIRMRQGLTVSDYLGLGRPELRTVLWWGLGLLPLWAGSDALTMALDRPIVPEVMVAIYRSTVFKPLIWLAMVGAGPLTEEFIFRGFLFRGWKESRLGAEGTIILTALLWALIHLQYDLYGMVTIFVLGIFLGLARLHTGSVWCCTILHAVMNLIAAIEVEFLTTAT